jgi:hypothetical protein
LRGAAYHEGFEQAAVQPQAAHAVARNDAEAHDEFIASLLLAVGEARRAKAVEHELEHVKVLRDAKCG